MEWLNDKAELINKPLTTDNAEQTEILIERMDNCIGQLDKKKKVSGDQFLERTLNYWTFPRVFLEHCNKHKDWSAIQRFPSSWKEK